MTFTSEQIQHARELARERRKYGVIQRLQPDEFKMRPAKRLALLRAALVYEKLPNQVSNISAVLFWHQ